ncbi:DUF4365 domain-containing protein [Nocardiopsis terrae]
MMEEESGSLLRKHIPKAWVIHEYKPDYGIDGTIEIFKSLEENSDVLETLGEHIFFQLKSAKTAKLYRKTSTGRMNPLIYGKNSPENNPPQNNKVSYDAIAYDLEVSELLTVESMGSSMVVVLFFTPLDKGEVYVVSLTDYIDRVLNFDDPKWREKTRKRVYIPTCNRLPSTPALGLLRQYGKRAKMMSLFSTLAFQYRALEEWKYRSEERVPELAKRFCERLLLLDVWHDTTWRLMRHYHYILEGYSDLLSGDDSAINRIGQKTIKPESPEEDWVIPIAHRILVSWEGLNALGVTYEDLVREWGLPTYNGILGLNLDSLKDNK